METLNSIMSLNKAQNTQQIETAFNNTKQWMLKDLEGAVHAKSYRKAMDTFQGLHLMGSSSDAHMA